MPFRSSNRSGPALKLPALQQPCRPPASSARRRRCVSVAAVCCNCVLGQIRELPCSAAASSRLDSRRARSMTPSSATCWRITTSASSCTPTTWAPGSSRTSAGCARLRPCSSLRPAAPATHTQHCLCCSALCEYHRGGGLLEQGLRDHGESVVLMGKNTMMKRSIRLYCERTGNEEWPGISESLVGNVGLIFTKGDLNEVRPPRSFSRPPTPTSFLFGLWPCTRGAG